MKKLFLAALCAMLASLSGTAQQKVTCNELMTYIKENAILRRDVTPHRPSSWLNSVTMYDYRGTIYVIAFLEVSAGKFKPFIFCGVPYDNWDNFDWEIIDEELSLGQKFRKYIYKFKCDCN